MSLHSTEMGHHLEIIIFSSILLILLNSLINLRELSSDSFRNATFYRFRFEHASGFRWIFVRIHNMGMHLRGFTRIDVICEESQEFVRTRENL